MGKKNRFGFFLKKIENSCSKTKKFHTVIGDKMNPFYYSIGQRISRSTTISKDIFLMFLAINLISSIILQICFGTTILPMIEPSQLKNRFPQ